MGVDEVEQGKIKHEFRELMKTKCLSLGPLIKHKGKFDLG
jgi:hypothetical protein